MDRLTLIMPYYDNGSMLELQYRGWLEWPESIKGRFRVVLIDDASPNAPAAAVARPDGLPAVDIYRVLEDIPWHQHGARNLGAHIADDGWLLLTDMDHVLSGEAASALFARMDAGLLDPGTIYTMDRIEADTLQPTLGKDGNPKPHCNSFVMTRETYWKVGGYDEDYCGIYGTDKLFRDRLASRAIRGHLDIPLLRYWRDLIPDASTNGLPRSEDRKVGEKRARYEAIARAKAARGEAGVVKVLQFDWERVV